MKTTTYLSRIIISRAPYILALIIFSLFLKSCARPTPIIQTQEVLIPIKCDITMPSKPKKQASISQTLAQILKYTNQLEHALKTCTH